MKYITFCYGKIGTCQNTVFYSYNNLYNRIELFRFMNAVIFWSNVRKLNACKK